MAARSGIHTHRHDAASLFQSLAEEVARKIDDRKDEASAERGTVAGQRPSLRHPVVAVAERIADYKERDAGVPDAAPDDLKETHGADAVEGAWSCAKIAAELLDKKLHGKTDEAKQLEDELKFSTCDPAWAGTIAEYEKYFGVDGNKRPIPYVRYTSMDDFVLEVLPPNAKVAVVGDWGTGTDDARRLLQKVAALGPDVLVHLGDIYYSGTPDECRRYFLDVIDEVFARQTAAHPIPVYTMTGNHDMYSGGAGYYGLLPQLNPSPPFPPGAAQPASYCALRSPDGAWQLLLMDTGLHDHDPFTVNKDVTYLDPQEEAWHLDKITRFTQAGGRTLLFSHHQLFSAFSAIGDTKRRPPDQQALNPKLYASFQRFAKAGDIAGWFWGHEHNLAIYQPYKGLAKGVCMGHGAIPVLLDDNPYKPLPGASDLPQLVDDPAHPGQGLQIGADGDVYAHGFVLLQLDDDRRTATATYYLDSQEGVFYEEVL